jgi:hypothetical protein
MTTAGDSLTTLGLALSVLITLVVYWLAEQYAEVLGGQVASGRLPTWGSIRAALAGSWPIVSASFAPLLALLVARLAGATASAAATVGVVAAVVLLTFHGWRAGRAAHLHGWPAGGHHVSRSRPRPGHGRAQERRDPAPALSGRIAGLYGQPAPGTATSVAST